MQRIQSPAPIVPTGIEAEVCKDITERQQFGINKYGQTVADNPLALREWLVHAYQESLDFPIYLKRAITEIDAIMATKPFVTESTGIAEKHMGLARFYGVVTTDALITAMDTRIEDLQGPRS